MTKKELRRETIKDCARELFIESNIEQATFAEIAKLAGVGEATVYRHFENKGVLAMAIAMDYVSAFSEHLTETLSTNGNSHLQRLELVLDYYIDLFQNRPDYFIFLEHFDNFIVHLDVRPDGFREYEQMFEDMTQAVCDITSGEKLDGSIKEGIDVDLTAYTFNITFMSLCQKLLLRGRVTEEDSRHNKIDELVLMKTVMIDSLKK